MYMGQRQIQVGQGMRVLNDGGGGGGGGCQQVEFGVMGVT